jgi:hypothetical protein
MQKEYGKLSEDQFKRLIKQIPELRKQEKDFESAVKSASKEKLKVILTEDLPWASMYELSYVECLAWLTFALGIGERVITAAKAADPQEEILRDIEAADDSMASDDHHEAFSIADIAGLLTVAQRNVLSIMFFKRSVCALVAESRDRGPEADDSLFNAIRIDPTVITCETAARRISEATWLGDKRFLIRLRSALKGPQKRHWEGYQDLRYSLVVLREMGLNDLSDDQLEHLLVKVLKVYPNSLGAKKNLRKQYYESKKIKSL